MTSRSSGILSPAAEPTPKPIDQPTQKHDDKNNMTATSASNMSLDRATTAPPQEQRSTAERKDETRAQSLEYKTHPEQARDPSQTPSNNNPSTTTNPFPTPIDLHDAAATILALRQQLYMAEQHILAYRNDSSSHILHLENLIHSSWNRSASLEANVNYLANEVHKANDYNTTLNQHIIDLRQQAEIKDTKHRVALHAANLKAKASSSRTSASRTPPVLPPPPPPPPAAMQQTLLEHNRASILKLRAEVRELKASKKQLQERLLTLGSVPALDGSTFLQSANLPREVLDEWSQVLLQRDREIAGLWVMVDREREAR